MGLLDRFRRRAPAPIRYDPLDPALEVCIHAFDAARADSDVLREAADAGVDLTVPLLVRHHLVALPDSEAVEQARRLLTQDGYDLVAGPATARPLAVLACRTEVLTALSASRERSRAAGLAQRLGGDVDGWDALRPRSAPPTAAASG